MLYEKLFRTIFFHSGTVGSTGKIAQLKRNYIPVIPVILLIALITPVSGAGFYPDGGTFSDPVEISINSTIDAWAGIQPDADSLQAYRWRFNPAAFAIISGDDRSRNVTFRAIKETKKPEAISYGRRDCSGNSGKDSLCSASEKASQKYWRIIRISPPVTALSVTTTGAGRSASVRFTDLSTGSPSSWSWNFGDGWGSADQNPEHTYEKSGKYTVTLITANNGGNNSATTTVDVEVPEPAVFAGSPGPDTVSRAGSVAANAYPSGTVSVLHFNTNGAVIDDTGRSWVPTYLSYSNSNYKFGGGSVLFNGNSWIYSNNDTAFSPGSENFTIAGWIYFSSNPSGWAPVWGNWWTNQGGTSLDYYGGKPRIVYDTSGTTKVISGTRNLPLNTWSYIVLQGKNAGGTSDITLYVNGVPNGTVSGVYNIRKAPSQTRFYFGRATTAAYYLQSGTYVDDFFMVKGGPAMYEGPFTPPTQEFGTPAGPVADFTGSPVSGTSPLQVHFTDTSTGSPTSWNWSFGDGEYSIAQDPVHTFIVAGTYTISLTAGDENGNDTETKLNYVSVTCPSYVSCDVTLTNPPYIDYTINRMRCPEVNSGNWWDASCLANAMIRWSRAGYSGPFYTKLSPWMWKRSACCPNPGYSWAFDSPANKPIYYAAVQNPSIIVDDNGTKFSHAIAAEYLGTGNANESSWQDWKFFQYENLNINVSDWQLPKGTDTDDTSVTINEIMGFQNCGQSIPKNVISFTIDHNSNITPHRSASLSVGYIVSKTGKTLYETQIIPDDLKKVIQSMNGNSQFSISKWEFDPSSKGITLYIYDVIDHQVMDDLQGKRVGKYSIRVVHDTEFEKSRENVRKQLADLWKNPDYQIAGTAMVTDTLNDPPQNYVEVWVYRSTPENKKLDNSVINGWKILIYPESFPPSGIRKS